MINYQILRDLWAIIAVLTGLALVFIIVLTYFDLWRPRSREVDRRQENGSAWLLLWRTIPWSLKITYFVLVVWALLYGIYLINNPPNW